MASTSTTPIRLAALASVVLVSLAYANHWQNPFHFDDSHAIVDNPHIRSLANLPRLITDAGTASIYTTHGAYRPVTSVTLAVDYAIGGGLNPPAFHASTFVAFLLLIGAIGVLCRHALDYTAPHPWNPWFAWLAATLFGVHPVSAQTVNYIIQRAEVWSALGVVGALALFAARPGARHRGLFLVPAVLGVFAKTIASIFPVLLFLYLWIVERPRGRARWAPLAAALVASGTATLICARMTFATGQFDPGAPPVQQYLWTQPWIVLRYLSSFLAPVTLSLDPGWRPLGSPFEARAVAGLAGVVALVALTAWLARVRQARVVSFGLAWFLAALIPVTVFPLAEVTNDHRMFLPFVGLALATGGIARILVDRVPLRRSAWALGLAALVLCVAAAGTWQRNTVWASGESAWAEAVARNPANGRARMNYGVALMARGAMPEALEQFEQAAVYTPAYSVLEVNLGVVKAALGRLPEAEAHFQRATSLTPASQVAFLYYGRWLREQGRVAEAVDRLEQAARLGPGDMQVKQELLVALMAQHAYARLREVAADILRMAPDDAAARRAMQLEQDAAATLAAERASVLRAPTPEGWLDLSLRLYHARDYQASLDAARQALALRPDYAEAYNNIAAAHNGLEQWAEAVAAADRALQIKPDFPLARNNRAWAAERLAARR